MKHNLKDGGEREVFATGMIREPQGDRLEKQLENTWSETWKPVRAANADRVCNLIPVIPKPNCRAREGGTLWLTVLQGCCQPNVFVCDARAVMGVALRFKPRTAGSSRRIELARPTCSAILRKSAHTGFEGPRT